MKLSLNFNKKDKSKPFGFSMEECLSEDEASRVKNLDLNKLIGLDRNERLNTLMTVISESKANLVNSHLEKDIILKRQKDGMIEIFNEEEIDSKWRKEINKRILDLEKVLDDKELKDFIGELVELKNGVGLGLMTVKQAEKVLYDEYADFLQADTNRFGSIFPITPPVSFLPYHPKYIKEAINILKTYCEKKGEVLKIKAIENVEPFLWYIKEDEECMIKLVEDIKWRDLSIELIKKFPENPNQLSYIERYLEGKSLNEIDFENLDIDIGEKLLKIFVNFYKDAHFKLSILFSKKIPESLLPFSKIKIIKLIDFYIGTLKLNNEQENFENFTDIKNEISEEYISDEIAMEKFFKNISNKETMDSIISELQEYQFEKIKKLLAK